MAASGDEQADLISFYKTYSVEVALPVDESELLLGQGECPILSLSAPKPEC